MLCDRAIQAAWGDVELDPFVRRHLRWCGRCREHHPQHQQLREVLAELRDAFVRRDDRRIDELFAALDGVDRQRRQRTVAAVTGAAAAASAALVMAGRSWR